MLLILMLRKNVNHSLLDSFFCSKLTKFTRVSKCPLSSLEQFLALIPRHTSCTYSIDNGFKLPLGQNELCNCLKLFFVSLNSLLLLSDLLPYSIQQDFFLLDSMWKGCYRIHFKQYITSFRRCMIRPVTVLEFLRDQQRLLFICHRPDFSG